METLLTFAPGASASPMVRALEEFRPQIGAAVAHVTKLRAVEPTALLVIASPVVYAALRPHTPAARRILRHADPAAIPGRALVAADCALLRDRIGRANADIAAWVEELAAYVTEIQPAITLAYMGPDGWGYARCDVQFAAKGGAA